MLGGGFLVLYLAPILMVVAVVVVVQVICRAGSYAVFRPAQEMLYVVLNKEEKYKEKNVIDTVVYRRGDALSAWLYSGLQAMGLAVGHIALLVVQLAATWGSPTVVIMVNWNVS